MRLIKQLYNKLNESNKWLDLMTQPSDRNRWKTKILRIAQSIIKWSTKKIIRSRIMWLIDILLLGGLLTRIAPIHIMEETIETPPIPEITVTDPNKVTQIYVEGIEEIDTSRGDEQRNQETPIDTSSREETKRTKRLKRSINERRNCPENKAPKIETQDIDEGASTSGARNSNSEPTNKNNDRMDQS